MNVTHTTTLRILLTSTASDSHTWNLVYLQLLGEELGHEVTVLGACVPPPVLVDRCLAGPFDLVVVSSVNGHGFRDGLDHIEAIRARPELAEIPVVIGGKLGTDGLTNIGHIRRLRAAGFDRVFGEDVGEFVDYVGGSAARRSAS